MTRDGSLSPWALTLLTLRDPRGAARAVASAGFELRDAFVMAGLGLALWLLGDRLLAEATGADLVAEMLKSMRKKDAAAPSALEVAGYVALSALLLYGAVTVSAALGGLVFGGAGTAQESFVTASWWFLVYAINEFVMRALLGVLPTPLNQMLLIIYPAVLIYLLVVLTRMIAEIHGFSSALMVFVAGLPIAIGVLAALSAVAQAVVLILTTVI